MRETVKCITERSLLNPYYTVPLGFAGVDRDAFSVPNSFFF